VWQTCSSNEKRTKRQHTKTKPVVQTVRKNYIHTECSSLSLSDARYMQFRMLLLFGQKRASDVGGRLLLRNRSSSTNFFRWRLISGSRRTPVFVSSAIFVRILSFVRRQTSAKCTPSHNVYANTCTLSFRKCQSANLLC